MHCGPEGYLVGNQFRSADLAAAALLFCMVLPKQYPFPYPASLRRWLLQWKDHPGSAWVREISRKHRGQAYAIEDRNG